MSKSICDFVGGGKFFMSVLGLLRLEICGLDFVVGVLYGDVLFFFRTLLE